MENRAGLRENTSPVSCTEEWLEKAKVVGRGGGSGDGIKGVRKPGGLWPARFGGASKKNRSLI